MARSSNKTLLFVSLPCFYSTILINFQAHMSCIWGYPSPLAVVFAKNSCHAKQLQCFALYFHLNLLRPTSLNLLFGPTLDYNSSATPVSLIFFPKFIFHAYVIQPNLSQERDFDFIHDIIYAKLYLEMNFLYSKPC